MPSDDVFTLQPDEPSRRSSAHFRRPSRAVQTEFQWPANIDEPSTAERSGSPTSVANPAMPVVDDSTEPELPATISPPSEVSTSKALGKNPNLPHVKRSLREIVERYLRDNGAPYINVDEAKRALFAGAKLRSFHFVVYRPEDKNWLVWATQLRKESRQDLLEWQKVFGDGFVAVVVKQMADAKLRFQTLSGEPVELK